MLLGILVSVLVLGILIIVHELGHFLFARRVDILCREFAFGMGPILWKRKKGETTFLIKAFPIGGYCAIAGEELENDPLKDKKEVGLEITNGIIIKIYVDINDAKFSSIKKYDLVAYDLFDQEKTGNLFIRVASDTGALDYPVSPQAMFILTKQEFQIAPYERTINSKRKRDRAMVMFGGPMMNFLLALLVFFLAGLIGGFDNLASSELDRLEGGTPAYDVGLRDGDIITQLSSGSLTQVVSEWPDISLFMKNYTEIYPSNAILVTYKRGDTTQNLTIHPQVIINSISLVSDYTSEDVKIGPLSTRSKAYQAGLREGQIITKVNGDFVTSWRDVYGAFIDNLEGESVTLEVAGEAESITVTPYSQNVMDSQKTLSGDAIPLVKVALGISATQKFDLVQSFVYSGEMTWSSMGLIAQTLKLLFTSNEVGVNDMGGFVAIISMTTNVSKYGLVPILNWIGLLSVNLGLLNLLPIPALDGGRLVFLGYEAITKKKPNQKVETALITITMLLLFGLMIYITFNDIMRLIGVR
ncbi:MAG: RIP metalloprotease RseP [Bacilli bacterium]|nr:RIP metalloprotease RseP [Bacilli bacterium]